MSTFERKARSELRQWSTYRSVGEWFDDYHGYVPIQMAAGLGMLIRTTGMSFPDAYRHLLQRGTIIHIDPADGAEPDGTPESVRARGERGRSAAGAAGVVRIAVTPMGDDVETDDSDAAYVADRLATGSPAGRQVD